MKGVTECPACGKRSYPSRYSAKRALRLVQGYDHIEDHGVSVYRCWLDHGVGWHFGHMSEAARPPRRDRHA